MIAYGYSIKEQDDPLVKVVEAAVSGFSETLEPGAFLVDVIPSRECCFLHHWGMLITPAFISLATLTLSFRFAYGQCNTCPTGSPELDGKSRPSDSHNC